ALLCHRRERQTSMSSVPTISSARPSCGPSPWTSGHLETSVCDPIYTGSSNRVNISSVLRLQAGPPIPSDFPPSTAPTTSSLCRQDGILLLSMNRAVGTVCWTTPQVATPSLSYLNRSRRQSETSETDIPLAKREIGIVTAELRSAPDWGSRCSLQPVTENV